MKRHHNCPEILVSTYTSRKRMHANKKILVTINIVTMYAIIKKM